MNQTDTALPIDDSAEEETRETLAAVKHDQGSLQNLQS